MVSWLVHFFGQRIAWSCFRRADEHTPHGIRWQRCRRPGVWEPSTVSSLARFPLALPNMDSSSFSDERNSGRTGDDPIAPRRSHPMTLNKELLSVPEAAAHCGVSRSTVNNWIQAKRLFARRSGKNYSVPIADLLVLLRSTGKPVPSDLARAERDRARIGSFRHCWEYWEGREQDRACGDCAVYVNRLAICFTGRVRAIIFDPLLWAMLFNTSKK